MKAKRTLTIATIAAVLTAWGGTASSAQDRYTLQVPDGLAFSEFRGYERWQVVGVSQSGDLIEVILANPSMIDAYQAGIPGNGKPVPDGAKMAKVHWTPKPNAFFPDATVPGNLLNVDFMTFSGVRDDANHYFRTVPRFETAAPKYMFLNRLLAIGMGEISPEGPVHVIEEIL